MIEYIFDQVIDAMMAIIELRIVGAIVWIVMDILGMVPFGIDDLLLGILRLIGK